MYEQNHPQTVTATEMQAKAAQIIKRCHTKKQHFIVERHEFPIIAILPIEEYHQLMKLLPTPQAE